MCQGPYDLGNETPLSRLRPIHRVDQNKRKEFYYMDNNHPSFIRYTNEKKHEFIIWNVNVDWIANRI